MRYDNQDQKDEQDCKGEDDVFSHIVEAELGVTDEVGRRERRDRELCGKGDGGKQTGIRE